LIFLKIEKMGLKQVGAEVDQKRGKLEVSTFVSSIPKN
jgi:hypothetical protein